MLSSFIQDFQRFNDIKNDVENSFNEEKIKNIKEITDIYGIKHKISDENSSTKS